MGREPDALAFSDVGRHPETGSCGLISRRRHLFANAASLREEILRLVAAAGTPDRVLLDLELSTTRHRPPTC
jgi:hypothetical protein